MKICDGVQDCNEPIVIKNMARSIGDLRVRRKEQRINRTMSVFLIALFFVLLLSVGAVTVQAAENTVTAWDLIALINGQRAANGLAALSVDSSLMACAQSTASTMASYQMMWHIGDVSGRVSQFGYNGGGKAYATENFATGPATITSISGTWADYDHQIASTNPSYCHIGAGVAEANGVTYYIVQAAYPATGKGCSLNAPSTGGSGVTTGAAGGSGTTAAPVFDMSQVIASIRIAEPDESGKIYHVVQNGQSLWSIASAYGVKIEDVARWNNIKDPAAISLNQKLFIPDPETLANETLPTTVPTILPTMSADGKFRHEISSGETLWTISELWKANFQELKRINGLTDEMTLGLGWKLFIPVTPTVTSAPTMTPFPTVAIAVSEATVNATPTATTVPETATPTAKPRMVLKIETHLPQTSMRTFMILGIGVSLLIGIGMIAIGIYKGK